MNSANQLHYNMEDILNMAMDIGGCLLKCGAEVWRVEDTIGRICIAYGCTDADVFSITSMIVSTAKNGTAAVTSSRRIHSYSYNLRQLEAINSLSREICATTPEPASVLTRINGIVAANHITWYKKLIAYLLVSGGFAVFFGGSGWDALVSALVALVVFGSDYLIHKGRINMLAYTVVSSCIAGFAAIGIVRLIGTPLHLDKIIIGNVMLLIPGIGLTNGIKDLLCGDIVSGLLRFCESILVAVSVAVGFAIPLLIVGGF